MLLSAQDCEEVRIGLPAAAQSLERRISIKVYHGAEWLRPVMEEWTDVSPLPAWAAAVYRLRIISKGGQLNQLVDLVSKNVWIGWIRREEVWISWIIGLFHQI